MANSIQRGQTEIKVDHLGQSLTFIYPPQGPGNYSQVQERITSKGLIQPTAEETASLLHTIYCDATLKNEPEIQEFRKIMRTNWLWAFTWSLYIPNEGAYIQDHPEIRKGMPYMDQDTLREKLEANDHSVRFVPFGFKTGTIITKELENNEYIKAVFGYEGAKKLADVAGTFKNNLRLWSFENVSEPTTSVSALDDGWVDGRLDVGGDGRGDVGYGYAAGVLKNTSETNRIKK